MHNTAIKLQLEFFQLGFLLPGSWHSTELHGDAAHLAIGFFIILYTQKGTGR